MTTSSAPNAASSSDAALPGFDIREIPFSRRGSWLNLSPVTALHTTLEDVHLVSHKTGMHAIFRLEPCVGGRAVSTKVQATPASLTWASSEGSIEAVFASTTSLRLRGSGLGLRLTDATRGLTPFSGTYLFTDPIDRSAVFTSYETGRRYRVRGLAGRLEVVGGEALGVAQRFAVASGAAGSPWEILIEELEAASPESDVSAGFEGVREVVAREYLDYLDRIAPWRDERTPAADLAAYVLWSATVSPDGFLRRESVLMSKHWMDKVWSWDHCFNAIALAPGLPGAALDQFLAPFDHQDPTGALPDSIAHSEKLYNFVKPPIHGWALARLRENGLDLDDGQLREVYRRLAAWTRFWLDRRRMPGRALPYYQHGNDSGWDNSTTFDRDRVVEAPDLAAFLLVQLDVLSGLAGELGIDAAEWRREHEAVRTALVEQLWRGSGFAAVGALSGRESTRSSLLNLLPIAAGRFLGAEITDALAAGIRRHLTEWGPATERTDSAEYDADGYWRGPIWAPSTVLVEDGLRRNGHEELADEISRRFRRLCERSGFAENFDAITGHGLRDRAYTWTAAAYLMLARDAASRDHGTTSR